MKGAAGLSFAKYFKEILNGAFLNIPLKDWLLDEQHQPMKTRLEERGLYVLKFCKNRTNFAIIADSVPMKETLFIMISTKFSKVVVVFLLNISGKIQILYRSNV